MLDDLRCGCAFCAGADGLRLVRVAFEIADAAGLIVAARKDRVTIKPADQIFVVEGRRAVGCVRYIRRKLARLCGCWVDPAVRRQGLGELLVRHRVAYIERHTSVRAMDTYAFNSRLYLDLGFQRRDGFKIGTTLLRKVVER